MAVTPPEMSLDRALNRQTGSAQQCSAADSKADDGVSGCHPNCRQQHGFPSADVRRKKPGDKNRHKIPPSRKAEQQAGPGVVNAVDFPQEWHQIPHKHGGRAADKKANSVAQIKRFSDEADGVIFMFLCSFM